MYAWSVNSLGKYIEPLIVNIVMRDYKTISTETVNRSNISGDVKLEKYWAIRNVTEKYFPGNKMPVPQDSKKLGGISVKLRLSGLLADQIGPGKWECLRLELDIKQSRCHSASKFS